MAKIRRVGEKLRGERLRWFGHEKRREESYLDRRVMRFDKQGERTRGRPWRRWNDNINEDMKKANVSVGGGGQAEVENGDVLLGPRIGNAKKKKKLFPHTNV